MRAAAIKAIEAYLPEKRLENAELAALYPTWTAAKIEEKTGIVTRRLAGENECVSDMAVAAAEKLFQSGACRPDEVDFIMLCTQSPDYVMPTTACLIQTRLGIPTSCGAVDFNLGCSGFVYGLSFAKSMLETLGLRNVLLLTADTYSKFLRPQDHTVRTLFGDAAAATLIQAVDVEGGGAAPIGPFVFGTDGRGAEHLMVHGGGRRASQKAAEAGAGETPYLTMNGPEIFNFTIKEVPKAVEALLQKGGVQPDQVDYFVLHQANRFMLEHLRKKMGIPEERFIVNMQECGNTVSASIPLALKQMEVAGQLKSGQLVALVGFGVGLSWSATLVRWT
jgi:3-oxoacyl-[acyl-carrier-protein] synthase-3